MAFATIPLERAERVGILTLNVHERMNAIDWRMLEELGAAFDELEADDGVRAIVLTGAGKAFSSGFDLKEQMAARPEGPAVWREILARDFNGVMRFWHCPKPTIAAVRGHRPAGGCEPALPRDIPIAASDPGFRPPGPKVGAGTCLMLLPRPTRPNQ